MEEQDGKASFQTDIPAPAESEPARPQTNNSVCNTNPAVIQQTDNSMTSSNFHMATSTSSKPPHSLEELSDVLVAVQRNILLTRSSDTVETVPVPLPCFSGSLPGVPDSMIAPNDTLSPPAFLTAGSVSSSLSENPSQRSSSEQSNFLISPISHKENSAMTTSTSWSSEKSPAVSSSAQSDSLTPISSDLYTTKSTILPSSCSSENLLGVSHSDQRNTLQSISSPSHKERISDSPSSSLDISPGISNVTLDNTLTSIPVSSVFDNGITKPISVSSCNSQEKLQESVALPHSNALVSQTSNTCSSNVASLLSSLRRPSESTGQGAPECVNKGPKTRHGISRHSRGQYGTFITPTPGSHSQRHVTFDPRFINDQNRTSDNRGDLRKPRVSLNNERADVMSKEEVNNLCEDVGEVIIDSSSSPAQYRSLALVTFFCCPVCGIVAWVLSCKSRRCVRNHQQEAARRLIRHSNFCWRLAVIFGIITWFLCLIIFVFHSSRSSR